MPSLRDRQPASSIPLQMIPMEWVEMVKAAVEADPWVVLEAWPVTRDFRSPDPPNMEERTDMGLQLRNNCP